MLPAGGREERSTAAQVTHGTSCAQQWQELQKDRGLAPSCASSPPTSCLAGPFPSHDPGVCRAALRSVWGPCTPTLGRRGSDVSKSAGSLHLCGRSLGGRSGPCS